MHSRELCAVIVRLDARPAGVQCGSGVQVGHMCGTVDASPLAGSFLVLGSSCMRFQVIHRWMGSMHRG